MHRTRAISLALAALVAPAVHAKLSAKYALAPSEIRTVLAAADLSENFSGPISAAELLATGLFGRTRLRAQVRALVLAGHLTRRRRARRYFLGVTPTGKDIARDYVLFTHRAMKAILNP